MKPHFPYLLWHLTNYSESLFDLDNEAIYFFTLLAKAHYAQ